MSRDIYLDNSATTKPFTEVIDLMHYVLEYDYGNPSSMHSKGTKALDLITGARNKISSSLNVNPIEIYFTSGGTEGNNTAIIGSTKDNIDRGKHIITSVIEHPSVLNTLYYLQNQGYIVDFVEVDSKGLVKLDNLMKMIRNETILVSIMYVNNEIGSVQPIKEIAEIIKGKNPNIIFHVDAVQAYGKIGIYPSQLGIDLLTISGHKINGPKGIGALYKRNNLNINPILFGGDQENNFRPGTENVAAISGFGKAVEITFTDNPQKNEKIYDLKEYFKKRILQLVPSIKINTPDNDIVHNKIIKSAPHILSLSFRNIQSDQVIKNWIHMAYMRLQGLHVLAIKKHIVMFSSILA